MSRRTLTAWYGGWYGNVMRPERTASRQWPIDRVLAHYAGRIGLAMGFLERWRLSRLVQASEAWGPAFAEYDSHALEEEVARLRTTLLSEGITEESAVRSFALIREISDRLLQRRHHHVQLMGGFGLLQGGLVEMATGEGKTLTAILPAITVALAGIPVHVITVNEYLARRDANLLRPIFKAFGLSVGTLTHAESDEDRRRAYAQDIVYGVNKDIVFDYLRDGIDRRQALSVTAKDSRLKGLFFGIIDEADSILIDEARTPLVIARERSTAQDDPVFHGALALAANLSPQRHFKVDARLHACRLTEAGRRAVEEAKSHQTADWLHRRIRDELVEQALTAHHLYRRGQQYVVQDGKVQIVDEFTGRILPDRSWERGLHQLIELKEKCKPTPPRETIAKLTYPQFFRRYVRVSGMSGTSAEVAGELRANYGIQVLRVPTHRPCKRRFLGVRIFTNAQHRWDYVAKQARDLAAQGRAVLVGTRSVQASERLSAQLSAEGFPHVFLNAVQDQCEADIVALAGTPGRITVATNMAGRGTDIPLHPHVCLSGGLHVILTEFHESSRIDRQLFGRAARQGDPGSCEACASLDDDLFASQTPWLARLLKQFYPNSVQIPMVWAVMLRYWAQRSAEQRYANVRHQAADQEQQNAKAFSFTGILE